MTWPDAVFLSVAAVCTAAVTIVAILATARQGAKR